MVFHRLRDVDGIPNLYKSEKSLFDVVLDDNFEAEDLDDYFIDAGDYDNIDDYKDCDWYDLYRCLVYMTHCEGDDLNAFANYIKDKMITDINIPEDLCVE